MEDQQKSEQPEKKWSKEDISTASDLKGVMEAYHGVKKDRTNYTPLSELQTTVAEKLNNIGEEDKGFQFTILAEQTKNTEALGSSKEMMGGLIDEINRLPGRLSDTLHEGLKDVTKLPDYLQSASDGISQASRTIEGAATTIENASHRMTNNR